MPAASYSTQQNPPHKKTRKTSTPPTPIPPSCHSRPYSGPAVPLVPSHHPAEQTLLVQTPRRIYSYQYERRQAHVDHPPYEYGVVLDTPFDHRRGHERSRGRGEYGDILSDRPSKDCPAKQPYLLLSSSVFFFPFFSCNLNHSSDHRETTQSSLLFYKCGPLLT